MVTGRATSSSVITTSSACRHVAMLPLVVQIFSNEESANIIPVPSMLASSRPVSRNRSSLAPPKEANRKGSLSDRYADFTLRRVQTIVVAITMADDKEIACARMFPNRLMESRERFGRKMEAIDLWGWPDQLHTKEQSGQDPFLEAT